MLGSERPLFMEISSINSTTVVPSHMWISAMPSRASSVRRFCDVMYAWRLPMFPRVKATHAIVHYHNRVGQCFSVALLARPNCVPSTTCPRFVPVSILQAIFRVPARYRPRKTAVGC